MLDYDDTFPCDGHMGRSAAIGFLFALGCLFYGTAHDITTQKLAEEERLRLEHELIEVSHREQQRVGRDLHDDLGQLLTGIAFLAKTVEQKLSSRELPEAGAISEIRSLVTTALGKMRILARGLSAATVAEEGLVSALQELAANTERSFGVRCRFELRGSPQDVPSWAAVHQYRIVQEAISNAIHHGTADQISIILSADKLCTALLVRDNGIGFGLGVEVKDGLGLRMMRYRAELIGGSIAIESTPGETRVHCRLPAGAKMDLPAFPAPRG